MHAMYSVIHDTITGAVEHVIKVRGSREGGPSRAVLMAVMLTNQTPLFVLSDRRRFSWERGGPPPGLGDPQATRMAFRASSSIPL